MSRPAIRALIGRWMQDPSFRDDLSQDLEGAIRQSDAELDSIEWMALDNWRRLGQSQSNDGYPLFF